MNDADQRMCDGRHHDLDAEMMRLRHRLDGNGSEGLVARVRTLEDRMPDFKDLKKAVNTLSVAVIVLALLTGADIGLKAAPLLKLVIP